VESSIIPLNLIYEHRVYLPSAGLITALVSAVFLITMRSNKLRKAAIVFFIVLTAVFAFATHARNNIWRSEVSLWQDTAEKSPHISRPHNNLCNAYIDEGLLKRGIEHCLTAIELDPACFRAYNNLGRAYLSLGRKDEAINLLREALRIRPFFVMAHTNLGAAYINKGFYDMAIDAVGY
jgi:tetratricopeptide (TPR) repeat protein